MADAPSTARLTVTSTSGSAAEGTDFLVTIARTGDISGTSTARFTVFGTGSNPAQADDFDIFNSAEPFSYSTGRGTVVFAPGETSTTVRLPVAFDAVTEGPQTFAFRLQEPSFGSVIDVASTTGTILDASRPDLAYISVIAKTPSLPEGNSSSTPFIFELTRSGNTATPVSVIYFVTPSGILFNDGPIERSDFTGGDFPYGAVSFIPGQTKATVQVDIAGDTMRESDEFFTFVLNDVTSTGAFRSSTGFVSARSVVLNDDPVQAVHISATPVPSSILEGSQLNSSGFVDFNVIRTGDVTGRTTLLYSITGSGDHPATADDFSSTSAPAQFPSGTIMFEPGVESLSIRLIVNPDTVYEPDEGFTLTLSAAPTTPAVIDTPAVTAVILNDDPYRPATLRVGGLSADLERDSGTTVLSAVITQIGDTTMPLTVEWAVVGSGTAPADATDFAGGVLPSGTVFFAPGETAKAISIGLAGDRAFELDETYTVSLRDPSGTAIIDTSIPAGRIVNDDTGRGVILVNASEDFYGGHAQFIVLADGQQVGGVQTVTASHAAGEHQGILVTDRYFGTPSTVAIKFVNDLYEGSPTQDRNLYVERVVVDGKNYAATAGTNTAGTSTFGEAGLLGSGPNDDGALTFDTRNSLTLRVAEDAYAGDAQFVVLVDGRPVGGIQTATASHAAGQWQDITVKGGFSTDPASVAVKFVNDLYGGGPDQDRNLWVDSLTIGGTTYQAESARNTNTAGYHTFTDAVLFGSGLNDDYALTFDTSRTMTLRVWEDAYQGDAQFVVFVDGRQVGGVRTATASHAAGEWQDITVTGGFAADPSTVAIDFVNDLYDGSQVQDRNLYVDKVTLPNGVVLQGEAAYNTAGPNTLTEAVLAGAATSGDHGLTFLIHA